MQITLTTENGDVFSLEVSHELTLEDLKALVEIETGGSINPDNMLLIHNMTPMGDLNKPLGGYDIKHGDLIMIVEQSGDVNVSNPAPLSQPSSSSQPQAQSLQDIDWSALRVPESNAGTVLLHRDYATPSSNSVSGLPPTCLGTNQIHCCLNTVLGTACAYVYNHSD